VDRLHRQQYNDVNYEFNEAEQKWQNKHANSKTVKFYKFWEKVITPRNLFFFIPLGVASYYLAKSAIKQVVAGRLTESATIDTPRANRSSSGTDADAIAGSSSSSSSGGASVRAWLNPVTHRWETPAPWNSSFHARDVKMMPRSKVHESSK